MHLAELTVNNIPPNGNRLFISSNGQDNFGPANSNSFEANTRVLTGNGDDKFEIVFDLPTEAVGFDTCVTSLAPAEQVQVFGVGNTVPGTFELTHAANVIGFFGVIDGGCERNAAALQSRSKKAGVKPAFRFTNRVDHARGIAGRKGDQRRSDQAAF